MQLAKVLVLSLPAGRNRSQFTVSLAAARLQNAFGKGNFAELAWIGGVAVGLVLCANFLTGPRENCGHKSLDVK